MVSRRIEGWVSTNKLEVDDLSVVGYAKIDYLVVDKLYVNGVLVVSHAEIGEASITGLIKAEEIVGNKLVVEGYADMSRIKLNYMYIRGRMVAGNIRAIKLNLELTGTSRIQKMEASSVSVKSIVVGRSRGRLMVEEVYARELELEYTNSRLVACCECSLGEVNRIERLFYGKILGVDPSTIFISKPILLDTLCLEELKEALDLSIPTSPLS